MPRVKRVQPEWISVKDEWVKAGFFKQKHIYVPDTLDNIKIWSQAVSARLETTLEFESAVQAMDYVAGYIKSIEYALDWLDHSKSLIASKLDPDRARASKHVLSRPNYTKTTDKSGYAMYGDVRVQYPILLPAFMDMMVLKVVSLSLGYNNEVERIFLEVGYQPDVRGGKCSYINVDKDRNIKASDW